MLENIPIRTGWNQTGSVLAEPASEPSSASVISSSPRDCRSERLRWVKTSAGVLLLALAPHPDRSLLMSPSSLATDGPTTTSRTQPSGCLEHASVAPEEALSRMDSGENTLDPLKRREKTSDLPEGLWRCRVVSMESISQQLRLLWAGQSAWFWFCSHSKPILLIQRLHRWKYLEAQRERVIPPGALVCRGLVTVGEDGVMRFACQQISMDMLAILAQWCHHNIAAHPGLARLRNAQLTSVQYHSQMMEVWEEPHLWKGISALPVPGGQMWFKERLMALKIGERARVWMTPSGPNGTPFLAVQPFDGDPDGDRFLSLQKQMHMRCSGPGIVGTIRVNRNGQLLFIIFGDVGMAFDILSALSTIVGNAGRTNKRLFSQPRPV